MLLPADEKRFLQIVAAYEEEFGPETLIITIPKRLAQIYNKKVFYPMEVKEGQRNVMHIISNKYSANFEMEL